MKKKISPEIMLLIPNLGLGGAQRVFQNQGEELANYYRVTEVAFNIHANDLYSTHNRLISLNVEGGGRFFNKLYNFGKRIYKLKNLKHQLKTSICISHLEGADYVNLLSQNKEKTVLCVHGSKLHDRNMSGPLGWIRQRLLIPLIYRQASCIVTVSEGIRVELVEELGLPADKVRVINNFFDVELIKQQASLPLPDPYTEILNTCPVIATAGRFAPEKNLVALLNVFARIRQYVPQCKLLLVGQGEQYQDLLNHCESLKLLVHQPNDLLENAHEAAVLMVGYQTNPHMFIARSTVFVMPSLNEGFPMSLGEAMVCGLPVVAADCPTGPREILSANSDIAIKDIRQAEMADFGILMPVIDNQNTLEDDQQVWTETLCQLLNDPIKREKLGQLASQRMQDFTREKISSQWIAVLEDVLAS